MTDINVEINDDPVSVSVSNAPGPAGASSFFKGVAAAWPPTATPTAGWIYTLPDPVPSGTPTGFLAGYGAQWDGSTWNNIGPVRGPAGPAGPQGVAGNAGSPGVAGTNGTNGTNGSSATITVGSVTTGAAGTSASVVNAGTSSDAVLNITIPRGDAGAAGSAGAAGPQGPQGPAGSAGSAGAAATVSVGTVTTGAAGSSASVTNVGTSSAAVLNITIPRGDTGAAGAAGSSGVISVTAPLTNSGTSSAAVLGIDVGTTAGTVAAGNDSRFSNARTPTAHAASHATGGADAITPASIGAQKTITSGTAAPTGGSSGDIYLRYT